MKLPGCRYVFAAQGVQASWQRMKGVMLAEKSKQDTGRYADEKYYSAEQRI